MRLKCEHSKCGTVIDMPDTGDGKSKDAVEKLMADHVQQCHSTFEETSRSFLSCLRDKLAGVANGGDRFTPGDAREYFTQIEVLLGGDSPMFAEADETAKVATPEKKERAPFPVQTRSVHGVPGSTSAKDSADADKEPKTV